LTTTAITDVCLPTVKRLYKRAPAAVTRTLAHSLLPHTAGAAAAAAAAAVGAVGPNHVAAEVVSLLMAEAWPCLLKSGTNHFSVLFLFVFVCSGLFCFRLCVVCASPPLRLNAHCTHL
jgi:hypothetical protein